MRHRNVFFRAALAITFCLQAEAQWCKLASLSLRFHDQPVDLVPLFKPSTYTYSAVLDNGMDSFSVDAVPGLGCQNDRVPNLPLTITPGGQRRLQVFAKDPKTDQRQPYSVTVTRLSGSETEVRFLGVEGAYLSPAFNPERRDYKAILAINRDFANLIYELADAGQQVHGVADPQRPSVPDPDTHSSVDTSPPLWSVDPEATGDVQYVRRSQSFPIDVGYSRILKLSVLSTDPTKGEFGTYTVEVVRPGCTSAKPLFDKNLGVCTSNCPSSFYANVEATRCSECNTNCAVCRSIFQCDLCREDTADTRYIIQGDGSCHEVKGGMFAQWMWWVIGVEVFLALLLCIGLYFLCQCLCSCCCGKERPGFDYISDDES